MPASTIGRDCLPGGRARRTGYVFALSNPGGVTSAYVSVVPLATRSLNSVAGAMAGCCAGQREPAARRATQSSAASVRTTAIGVTVATVGSLARLTEGTELEATAAPRRARPR